MNTKLNTDVRQLVTGKKTAYPTKRSMNLYFKVDRTTAPATAALYILFGLAILLALSKVMLYDPWAEVQQLEAKALALEERSADQLVQLADYNDILESYIRAVPTEAEQAQVDCVEILDLIDQTIRPAAAISQITISENQVLLTFSGVTLGEAADLVSQLEQSPLVTAASVDTAASTQENQSLVEINVYFEAAREEIGS